MTESNINNETPSPGTGTDPETTSAKRSEVKKAFRTSRAAAWRGRSGSSPKNQRSPLTFLLPLLTGLLGIFLGVVITFSFLPGSGLFRGSALGRYIAESAQEAAQKQHGDTASLIAEAIAKAEEQRKILAETGSLAMSVTDIVAQNRSSVVTVVAMIEDPDYFEDYRTFIGTGFILNGEGMIATNHHVIAEADELSVILSDGREVSAREVNSDPDTDLSIISLKETVDLPGIVNMGDSEKLEVGEQVVAIGSPVSRDFAGSVTAGIISGKDREVVIDNTTIRYLQTDAAINEGNSGGPLFNARGEVIGINTAKLSEDVQGIGFAIPINILKEKLGYLSRVPLYSGLSIRNLNPQAYEVLGIDHGIVVIEVAEGSPADRAGVQVQDIILEYDGQKITSSNQFIELREAHEEGDQVKALLKRGDLIFEVSLELIRRQ